MKTVVISLFINKELPIYNSILFFNSLIKDEFNKEIEDIELIILDLSTNNAKLKSKKTKYSEKGLEKIKLYLENNKNEKFNIGYQISIPLKKIEYKAIDLDVSINYSTGDNKSIYFYINYEGNQDIDVVKIISNVYGFLKNNFISISYGFSFIMENKKMPTFFAAGILTENLTREEEIIVERMNSKNIKEILSPPFWLTCFNIDVFNIDVNEIVKLVGTDNFVNLDSSLKLFTLPQNIRDFNFNKKDKIKKDLVSLMNRQQADRQ